MKNDSNKKTLTLKEIKNAIINGDKKIEELAKEYCKDQLTSKQPKNDDYTLAEK